MQEDLDCATNRAEVLIKNYLQWRNRGFGLNSRLEDLSTWIGGNITETEALKVDGKEAPSCGFYGLLIICMGMNATLA